MQQSVHSDSPTEFATNVNTFYARYDAHDFKEECDQICELPVATHVPVTTEAVRCCFARLSRPHKIPGPDGLRGRVLRECASQLGQNAK